MGSIASGIYNLFAGDPAKKEEGQLGDLGNFESGVGQQGTNASLGYDLGILSGDPAKIAQTLAPEISTQNQQTQQGKLTTANSATALAATMPVGRRWMTGLVATSST